jgi:hypothetical protein
MLTADDRVFLARLMNCSLVVASDGGQGSAVATLRYFGFQDPILTSLPVGPVAGLVGGRLAYDTGKDGHVTQAILAAEKNGGGDLELTLDGVYWANDGETVYLYWA